MTGSVLRWGGQEHIDVELCGDPKKLKVIESDWNTGRGSERWVGTKPPLTEDNQKHSGVRLGSHIVYLLYYS
jgi:hypothetical protein